MFSFFLECPTVEQIREYRKSSLGRQLSAGRILPSLGTPNVAPAINDLDGREHWLPVDIRIARVFVVDDVVINAKVLCKMLHRLGFQDVRFFTGGKMALKVSFSVGVPYN